jgi:hypothetical protein
MQKADLLFVACSPSVLFDCENRGDTFLQYMSKLLPDTWHQFLEDSIVLVIFSKLVFERAYSLTALS